MKTTNYNIVALSQNSINNSQNDKKMCKKSNEELKMEVDDEEEKVDPNNPYEKIIITTNEQDEDIQCDICLEFEYEENNHIVLCDLCNTATH